MWQYHCIFVVINTLKHSVIELYAEPFVLNYGINTWLIPCDKCFSIQGTIS